MLKKLLTYLALIPLVYSFCPLDAQQRYRDWTWGGPIDPLQAKYEVLHYDINLRLIPEKESLDAMVGVKFSAGQALDTLRLNLVDLYNVRHVKYSGGEVNFQHYGDTLDVYLPGVNKGIVKIHYSGITPKAIMPPWKGGFVWTKDKEGNYWVGLSCQGEGAKVFMPCLDHPSSEPWGGIDLNITVPKPYFVAANGRLQKTVERGNEISYHWSSDYPVNNYGINFTMGIFHIEEDKFLSMNGEEIPIKVFALEYNKDKAAALLGILNRSAHAHETYFGPFPFPKDKIAVVETPYLGMEHQTINAYGNKYRFEKVGGIDHDWLLHHELGHEWWGNMVTVKDWADLWLHEGLTTYGDWLFYEEFGGKERYQKEVNKVGSSIMNLKPVVAPDNTDSDEAYHIEVYYKGAFIIHSLRFMLGDDVFFPMIKEFLSDERYTYDQLVTTEDFTAFVQDYSKKDLEGFFDMYLYTNDIPEIVVEKLGAHSYQVHINNTDFTLPVELQTSTGLKTMELSHIPVHIKSRHKIKVDPNGWYLKNVTYK